MVSNIIVTQAGKRKQELEGALYGVVEDFTEIDLCATGYSLTVQNGQIMPRLVFIKCKTAEEVQIIETNFACKREFDITFERNLDEPVTRLFTLEAMDEGRKGEDRNQRNQNAICFRLTSIKIYLLKNDYDNKIEFIIGFLSDLYYKRILLIFIFDDF